MLIYHPAFDTYHCIFRLLRLLETGREYEIPAVRILDFLLSFPAELRNISLPKGTKAAKKFAQDQANPYRGPLNRLQMFRNMEQLQMTAINSLMAAGLIDQEALEAGLLRRSNNSLPTELEVRLQAADNPLEMYIIEEFSKLPLRGINGLKQRTGLLDFRYDPA